MAAAMRRFMFPQRASDDFGAATSPAPAPFAPAARRAYSEHDGQRQETAGRRVGEENYP
jgi:hypothetical protein